MRLPSVVQDNAWGRTMTVTDPFGNRLDFSLALDLRRDRTGARALLPTTG